MSSFIIAPSLAIDFSLKFERFLKPNKMYSAFVTSSERKDVPTIDRQIGKLAESIPQKSLYLKCTFSSKDITKAPMPADKDVITFYTRDGQPPENLMEEVDNLILDWFDIQRESVQKIGLRAILIEQTN